MFGGRIERRSGEAGSNSPYGRTLSGLPTAFDGRVGHVERTWILDGTGRLTPVGRLVSEPAIDSEDLEPELLAREPPVSLDA